MGLIGAIRNHPLTFVFGLAAASLLGLLLLPPIPQPQDYHQFADRQTLLLEQGQGDDAFHGSIDPRPRFVPGQHGDLCPQCGVSSTPAIQNALDELR